MGTWGRMCAVGMVCGIVGAAPVFAQTAMTLPVTAQDHLTLAATYEQKAAAYREEAAYHRAMAEEAGRAERVNPKAVAHPQYDKMRRHCEPLIRDAERLAKDAEEFAKWHRMRAAELGGQ